MSEELLREIGGLVGADRPVVPDDLLADLAGVDSVLLLEMIVRAEDRAGAVMPEAFVLELRTVADLCAFVDSHRR